MLEINFRRFQNIAILDLTGSVDIDAANFIEMVAWCWSNGYKDILCNFENVNLVDYAGLSVLTIAYKDVVNHHARIKFVNVAVHIRKQLCLVCLDRVFEMYDDEQFALRTFEEDRVIAEIQKKQLRRRFKRLFLDIDIAFSATAKNEQLYHGKILNISGVGMLVFAEKTYPLGEIVDIRCNLAPSPGLVETVMKVVWLVQKEIQPQIYPGMGLEFHNMEPKLQAQIIEFVERNLSMDCSTEGN